jgi:hypothetical protein
MTKIKISIKNRFTGSIIFEYEKDDNTVRDTILEALKNKADLSSADLRSADLRYADLRYADLRYADLRSADLRSADLRSANLSSADLRSADLRYADLRSADLRSADLTVIKDDFFAVLVRSLPEIKFLRQNIIEGKINGSTYDGECACLSGTLANGAKKHNGPDEKLVIDNIISCRDSDRPIERLFLGIKKGDTPATSPVSKLVLEWLDEFIWYIYKIKLDEPS